MKKYRSLIAVAGIAATCIGLSTLQSCDKVANLLQYSLDLQTASAEVVLPPSTDTVGSASGSQVVYYNVDSFIRANTGNALGIDNIESVKIESCTLTLLNPTTANNFANFRSATGSVYSNSNTTPYSMSITNNPDVYATTMSLPVDTTVNLKSYLTGNQLTYSAGGSLRRATTDSVHVKVDFKFKIHVHG
jgi:hypothetical protein